MKSSELQKLFAPFDVFRRGVQELNSFESLSTLSYFAAYMVVQSPEASELQHQPLPKPQVAKLSATPEMEVTGVELICEWLSIQEYSARSGVEEAIVAEQRSRGELGHLKEDNTGTPYLIWPQTFKDTRIEDLPELGLKSFRVKVSRPMEVGFDLSLGDPDSFEETKKLTTHHLAKSALSVEKIEECHLQLSKACFLLLWIHFEIFMKSTVFAFFAKHPKVLFKRQKAEKLTMAEIENLSDGLTSMEALCVGVVERLVAERQTKESVSGLMKALNEVAAFPEDPFAVTFQYRGEKCTTSFQLLEEYRLLRNALVHQDGSDGEELKAQFPALSTNGQNQLIVTADYYAKANLAIRSLCYSLSLQVVKGAYQLKY